MCVVIGIRYFNRCHSIDIAVFYMVMEVELAFEAQFVLTMDSVQQK
jgi:hypothetical protein